MYRMRGKCRVILDGYHDADAPTVQTIEGIDYRRRCDLLDALFAFSANKGRRSASI